MSEATCPICQNDDFRYLSCHCHEYVEPATSNHLYDCPICGKFTFSQNAIDDLLAAEKNNPDIFPHPQRALVSHLFKKTTRYEPAKEILITAEDLNERVFNAKGRPSIFGQMNNGIIFMGTEFEKTGESFKLLPIETHAIIGSLNRIQAVEMFTKLKDKGYLEFTPLNNGGRCEPLYAKLTYEGARLYEELTSSAFEYELKREFESRHTKIDA